MRPLTVFFLLTLFSGGFSMADEARPPSLVPPGPEDIDEPQQAHRYSLPESMEKRQSQKTPFILRPIVHSLRSGMLLSLPIIDTDPNRGVTYGVMPIWVLKGKDGNIRTIHAPSLTYNDIF